MAFTCGETLQGFEWLRNEYGSTPRYAKFPATIAEAFTVGQPVTLSGGLVTGAAAAGTNILGISQESKTIPAVTDDDDDHDLLVLLCKPGDIFRVNIETPLEDSVVSAVGTTTAVHKIAFDAGFTTAVADDNANTHALVIYDGKGKGQWRIVYDYDAAGDPVGSQCCFLNRPFDPIPDTTSYCILIGAGTDTNGLHPGSFCDIGGTSTKKVNGADNGGPMRLISIDNLAIKGWVEVAFTDTIWQAP